MLEHYWPFWMFCCRPSSDNNASASGQNGGLVEDPFEPLGNINNVHLEHLGNINHLHLEPLTPLDDIHEKMFGIEIPDRAFIG